MHTTDSRVLICGDWHGEIPHAQNVIADAAAAGIETLYHVGDLGALYPHEGNEPSYDQRLSDLLVDAKLNLYFIDGNRDNHDALRLVERDTDGFATIAPNLHYLPRGQRWTHNGVHFGAFGGARSALADMSTEIVEGVNWWRIEEPTEEDVVALGTEPLDVLITHEAPTDLPVVGRYELPSLVRERAMKSRHLVDAAVRNTNPAMLFCGHWHQPLRGVVGAGTQATVLDREHTAYNTLVLNLDTLTLSGSPAWSEFGIPGMDDMLLAR